MIIECTNDNIKTVFNYIGEDYGKCLYIFIDLKKYGLDDDNFNVWIQYNNDKICAIISEYYNGIQIYSKFEDLIIEEIVKFIKQKDVKTLFSIKPIINKINEFLPNYKQETGIVGELKKLIFEPNVHAYSAPISELEEIVKLVSEDENIGKPYGYDSLFSQYYERKTSNFGRNFVLRDKINNEIICHAGTYAELPEFAVIGGVITSKQYRGKGFSKGTLSALCHQLKSENKRVFSYYYIPSATKMHTSVGFKKIEEWSKLSKID
ncbi:MULTISPECIES: GNAT family N-acetyltransferase [Methanobrevibacter]|uniref:N-acetyltransferase domain-containing protein n=1 Tax=Methanobrevibacter gottschalkii DSM 11977 TaxID=1122229 RepID=A0A3N5BXP0_9EURY|nr:MULTISPECIES: GNAT family N-acetyltransferase [Methanobrevibacter]OEC97288.1 hypothetical protein A9505_05595 [Methanobrevibacter sp. A27]RPF52002.1 hypothetical protein EDC42_1346 [Methanobrevibacter gottschalkii DSM 11977]